MARSLPSRESYERSIASEMSCSSLVSHRQLQARQGVHGIDEDDASVIENPLKLGGGLRGLIRREECQPAVVDGVQATESGRWNREAPEGEIMA